MKNITKISWFMTFHINIKLWLEQNFCVLDRWNRWIYYWLTQYLTLAVSERYDTIDKRIRYQSLVCS